MSIEVTETLNCKMQKANIFLIHNTLQLFNAIEAEKKFQTKNNILVLLFFGKKQANQNKIFEYLHLFPYDQLIIMDNCVKSNFIELNLELIQSLNSYQYNKLFTGFFSANIRRIICNVTFDEMYLLDDGTYAYALHNELYNPSYSGKPTLIRKYSEQKKIKLWRKIKFFLYHTYRKLYFNVHGYKNDFKTISLNFFTIFPLKQYKQEKIINHNFQKMKILLEYKLNPLEKSNNQYLYFLGQPLQKLHNISAGEYISYIEIIKKFYSNKNMYFIYIPHPEEDMSILNKLKKNENLETLLIKEPFEFYFLKNHLKIRHIASFFSSALFNIQAFDPSVKIESFILPRNKIIPDNIMTVYNFFKSEKFSMHQLHTN